MNNRFLITLQILFFFVCFALSLSQMGWNRFTAIERFDAILTDFKFKIRGVEKPSGEVVVVAFDDKSLEAFGRWKGNRQMVALLIDSLFKLGARNVALDILFSEPEPENHSRGDQILKATFKKYHERLTLAWALGSDGEPIVNLPIFSEEVTSKGFINAEKESDGILRRIPYWINFVGDKTGPSLALAAISQRIERPPQELVSKPSSPVNFFGPGGTIPTYSALDVVLAFQANAQNKINLVGKTVFVGVSAMGEVDQVATPFDKSSPGVEVQATAADRVLTQSLPKPSGLIFALSVLLLCGALSLLAVEVGHYQLAALLAVSFITFLLSDLISFKLGIYLKTGVFYFNLGFLSLSSLVFRYYQEYRQRTFLRSAFSKYLAPGVVDQLVANPHLLKLGGEKKEITILFCDIRNFTAMSERLEPAQINQLLNEIFSQLTEVIFKYQGTVDKYIGDALMALFGAPLDQSDHALRACQAAIEMVKTIENRANEFKAVYGVEIKVGIGINTGVAHVGNMGSRHRFNYTALGDSVNIASRVEDSTRTLAASVLVTEATLQAIKNGSMNLPQVSEAGIVTLKGKSQPLRLFKLTF